MNETYRTFTGRGTVILLDAIGLGWNHVLVVTPTQVVLCETGLSTGMLQASIERQSWSAALRDYPTLVETLALVI